MTTRTEAIRTAKKRVHFALIKAARAVRIAKILRNISEESKKQ